MASSGSPDSVSSAENLLRKESNEISDLFSKKTIEKLESIPEGSAVAAAKGDYRYIIKNDDGNLVIVGKEGNVNFDVPMSDRVPAGMSYGGKVTIEQVLSPESKKNYRESYGAFLDSKDKKITHNATDVLTQDNLLHGTKLESILGEGSILDKGLVPREVSGVTAAK